MNDAMERINALISERQELFRRAAGAWLPDEERARMKELNDEIKLAWDAYRREGHPPAVPPVPDDWERPRRGRKPRQPAEMDHAA